MARRRSPIRWTDEAIRWLRNRRRAGVPDFTIAQQLGVTLRQLQERVLARGVDPVIAILGVTYKENTHSIKNSPAVALIKALTGCRLTAFDPVVRASAEWHPRLTVADNPLAACDSADMLSFQPSGRD